MERTRGNRNIHLNYEPPLGNGKHYALSVDPLESSPLLSWGLAGFLGEEGDVRSRACRVDVEKVSYSFHGMRARYHAFLRGGGDDYVVPENPNAQFDGVQWVVPKGEILSLVQPGAFDVQLVGKDLSALVRLFSLLLDQKGNLTADDRSLMAQQQIFIAFRDFMEWGQKYRPK